MNHRHTFLLSTALGALALLATTRCLPAAGSPRQTDGEEARSLIAKEGARPGKAVSLAGAALDLDQASADLKRYRAQLDDFRTEYGGTRQMPDVPFFQFGMGLRTKYLFKNGVLCQAVSGREYRRWTVARAVIVPSDYSVVLTTADGAKVSVMEDETAVWIVEHNRCEPISGTELS